MVNIHKLTEEDIDTLKFISNQIAYMSQRLYTVSIYNTQFENVENLEKLEMYRNMSNFLTKKTK